MKIGEYEIHPACSLFPDMPDDEYEALREDIRRNGQNDAITVDEHGHVLDGRNRLRACIELGIAPFLYEYKGQDAFAFVMSANFHRRHLTDRQKAQIIERAGRETGTSWTNTKKAAAAVGVGDTTLYRARAIADADPELARQVEAGQVPGATADRIVAPPADQQDEPDTIKMPKTVADTGVAPSPHAAVLDGRNVPVPDKLLPVFEGIPKLESLATAIRQLRNQFKAVARERVGAALAEREQTWWRDLGNLLKEVEFATPYVPLPKDCKDNEALKKRGWLNRDEYDRWEKARKPKG